MTASMDSETLRSLVERLTLQVERLKQELGDLHGTDTVALRRAYTSIGQHVAALRQESQHVQANIEELQEDLVSSSDIAQAFVETGTVAAASFAATRAIRATPLQNLRNVGSVVNGVWMSGALYLGFRFVTGVCRKAWASGYTNPMRKRKLISDWQRLQERIAIMSELLQLDAFTSSSQLGHGVVREPPFPPLGLPAASEPPAA